VGADVVAVVVEAEVVGDVDVVAVVEVDVTEVVVVVDEVVVVEAEVVGGSEVVATVADVVVDEAGIASVAVVAVADVGAADAVESAGDGTVGSVVDASGAVTVTVTGSGAELVGVFEPKKPHDADPIIIHTVRVIPISKLAFIITDFS